MRSGLTGRAGVPFGKRSFDSQRRRVAAMAKRLDGHLHVWASREDAEAGKFPFAVCLQAVHLAALTLYAAPRIWPFPVVERANNCSVIFRSNAQAYVVGTAPVALEIRILSLPHCSHPHWCSTAQQAGALQVSAQCTVQTPA